MIDFMSNPDRYWPGLNPAQADGLACVCCGVDYLDHPASHVPVGWSVTGSQVFACMDSPQRCAEKVAAQ